MGVHSTTAPSSEPTPKNIEALLEAARYDEIDDVVSLFSSGTSLDCRDSQGRTGIKICNFGPINGSEHMLIALHMASANGHLNIVEYLLRNKADVNASNIENNTPLHWACLNGHIEVVKSLILAGASVSALNSHERTPIDEAVYHGKMEIVDAINTAVAQAELTSTSIV